MQEEELVQALAEYHESAAALEQELGDDATGQNSELLQMREELRQAIEATKEALQHLQDERYGGLEDQGAEAALQPQSQPAAVPAGPAPRARTAGRRPAAMHPRSAYAREAPHFGELAAQYPELGQYLLPARASGPPGLDFAAPGASEALARALLHRDYAISWVGVPRGALAPAVPNRANYIHWLQDLLELAPPPGGADGARGLDVGCGASLVYPLLGAAIAGWRFLAVDVSPACLAWARRNRDANPELAPLIELRRAAPQPAQAAAGLLAQGPAAPEGPAGSEEPGASGAAGARQPAAGAGGSAAGPIAAALRPGERLAFSLCNPPFFESLEEAGRNPGTAFGGTALEMVFPGGELAFVGAMVADSLALRGAVHWYTTMVGKKATLRAVRARLYAAGVRVLRTTEFFQGKTSRWGVAWSFTADPATANMPLSRGRAGGAAAAAPAGRAGPQGRKRPAGRQGQRR